MPNNSSLQAAKSNVNDEFYTQYQDIDDECGHYRKHFEGGPIHEWKNQYYFI